MLYRRPRLQAAASFLLLRHTEPETVALPMGMGVKLYSGFADGTLVITASFVSTAVPRANTGVRKQAEEMSIPGAWQRHQERVAAFTANGAILRADSFARVRRHVAPGRGIVAAAPAAALIGSPRHACGTARVHECGGLKDRVSCSV